jgi:hypothetical protein
MPLLIPSAVDALRRHLTPQLAAENASLRAQLSATKERIRMLEILLRDSEAAELLHEHCYWCFAESTPKRCERCVLIFADLHERRSQALFGAKGV